MKVRKIQRKLAKNLKFIILLSIIMILCNGIVKATNDPVTSEDWKKWQDEDYWEWHTRTTTQDAAYNGKHISINNNTINFYGYGDVSYKDFLYKDYENPGKKIFKFRIDETKANYHTLDGAGFIFNANKENDKLSGYILLFRQNDVCIYKINNVNINNFEIFPNTTIATYGVLIAQKPKTTSTIHDLTVEATPTNIKVTEADTEILNVDLDYSNHKGESFGLISSYIQHSCSILSEIEFSEIEIVVEDYKISVLNTDMDNNPLSNGYFEIKDEEGNIIKKGNADKNGIFSIDNIQEGTYTVQQKVAPSGYILNNNIYKFKVTNDGRVLDVDTNEEINLIVKNEKQKEEVKNNTITEENVIINEKKENIERDNTRANTIIPNAGEKVKLVIILNVLIAIIAIFTAVKLKEYKNVK